MMAKKFKTISKILFSFIRCSLDSIFKWFDLFLQAVPNLIMKASVYHLKI